MATTENVVIEVDVKTKGDSSVKSLKAELRSLKNEIGQLDPASEAFVKAAQRAGALQDQIEDVNNTVKAFNPEAKFQSFAKVLGGVASGFSAIQGAQALFGSENEDVQRAMLKTQAAMALATGLNGLLGMGDAFKDLALVIKTNVVTAFTTLKGALIATGIGALAVALGFVVSNFEAIAKAIDKVIPGFAELTGQTKQNTEAIEENITANEKAQEFFKRMIDFRISAIKDIRKREEAELKEQQRRQMQDLASNFFARADYQELVKNAQSAHLQQLTELKDKFAKEDADKAEAERKKELDAAAKHATDLISWRKTVSDAYDADKKKRFADRDEEEEDEKAREERRLGRQKASMDRLKKEAETKKDVAKEIAAAEEATMLATANGLNSIGQLVGEQTAAGKALGVASATIDTYVGANKALAQGGMLGFVGAAAIVLTGLTNVKRILSVKTPKGGGGAPSSAGLSGGSIPQVPTNSSSTILTGNKPVLTRQLNVGDSKVYVLESDITGTQGKVKNIVRKATIR